MRWVYNFVFNAGLICASPYYFSKMVRRGNWRSGFAERFGKYDARLKHALTNRHVVWFHAVSVGEVNLCILLIRELEPRLPNYKFVVSTTTSTGMADLKKRLPPHISCIYYPIDRRRYVQRAMGHIHPEAVILFEAEFWPNFLWSLQRRGIPHFLVNARLSPRSFAGYRRFGFLFRDLFSGFLGVGAQSEADADRLRQLGFRPEAIHVAGSLKFDAAKPVNLEERRLVDAVTILGQLGLREGNLILVAGSTHDGEEVLLAEMLIRLRHRFPNLFLVLVPRHQERGAEVSRILDSKGIKFALRSQVTPLTRYDPGALDCLLVNTTGELRFFYQHADLVFVGKSLTAESGKKGGQNPIEPAAFGKAVVVGPKMENFSDIVPRFLERKAMVQVQNANDLEVALAELLADPDKRSKLGANALEVVKENQGSLGRTLDFLLAGIPRF
jgi:3-deoxy-D-manno-octulosonic-acid transferase